MFTIWVGENPGSGTQNYYFATCPEPFVLTQNNSNWKWKPCALLLICASKIGSARGENSVTRQIVIRKENRGQYVGVLKIKQRTAEQPHPHIEEQLIGVHGRTVFYTPEMLPPSHLQVEVNFGRLDSIQGKNAFSPFLLQLVLSTCTRH